MSDEVAFLISGGFLALAGGMVVQVLVKKYGYSEEKIGPLSSFVFAPLSIGLVWYFFGEGIPLLLWFIIAVVVSIYGYFHYKGLLATRKRVRKFLKLDKEEPPDSLNGRPPENHQNGDPESRE